MTSFRQIEANERNALKRGGPRGDIAYRGPPVGLLRQMSGGDRNVEKRDHRRPRRQAGTVAIRRAAGQGAHTAPRRVPPSPLFEADDGRGRLLTGPFAGTCSNRRGKGIARAAPSGGVLRQDAAVHEIVDVTKS
jgi:hypothetical protein